MQSNGDEQPGPSGMFHNNDNQSSRDHNRSRPSRENQRLRSVVNIMHSNSNKNSPDFSAQTSSSSSESSNMSSAQSNNGLIHGDEDIRRTHNDSTMPLESHAVGAKPLSPIASDSEDDLPLNLTIQNMNTYTSL